MRALAPSSRAGKFLACAIVGGSRGYAIVTDR